MQKAFRNYLEKRFAFVVFVLWIFLGSVGVIWYLKIHLDLAFNGLLSLVTLWLLITLLASSFFIIIWTKVWRYLEFRKISRRTIILLVGIVLAGLFFRFNRPVEHYIYHDEESYIEQAVLIKTNFSVGDCTFGVFHKENLTCYQNSGLVPKKKEGFPLLLAALFLLTNGHNELYAFILNISLCLLTVIGVFFVAREVWSEQAGLYAALFVALLPDAIVWSVSTSLETSALFFFVAASLSFVLFLKKSEPALYFLSIILLVYASFIRPELVFTIPFVLFSVFWTKLEVKLKMSWLNLLISFIAELGIIFTAAITYFSNQFYYKTFISYYKIPALYSWSFFKANLANVIYYQFYTHNYLYITAAALIFYGVYRLFLKHPMAAVFIAGSAFFTFIVHTSYYFGTYQIMGVLHARFPMMWLIMLAPIVGIGCDLKVFNQKYLKIAVPVFFAVILICYLNVDAENLFAPSPHDDPRIEHKENLAFQKLNPNCIYVSPVAFRDIGNGYSAIDTGSFSGEWRAHNPVLTSDSCVVMLNTYLCQWQQRGDACVTALSLAPWKEVVNGARGWYLNSSAKPLVVPPGFGPNQAEPKSLSLFQIIWQALTKKSLT